MTNGVTKNTIFAYLSGQATPIQKVQIEDWLNSEKNQVQYYEWLMEWELEHQQFVPDTEKALRKIIGRVQVYEASDVNEPSSVVPPFYQRHKKNLFFAAASVLAFLFLFSFRNHIIYKSYNTTYAEVKTFRLKDGSIVTLNANSSLRIPRFGFGASSRDVLLQGEAAFSVVHTKEDKKFVVHTAGGFNVEVLGTQFSVFARNNRNNVKLEKGLVKVHLLNGDKKEAILIKPGDVLDVTSNTKPVLKHVQSTKDFFAWKEHRFVFDNTPLPEVIEAMEETFGISIVMESSVYKNRKVIGSFKARQPHELFTALTEMYNLEIEQQDSQTFKISNRNQP